MGKIIFKYGCMGAGKSLDIINTSSKLELKSIKHQVLKTGIGGKTNGKIKSRTGLEIDCRYINNKQYMFEIIDIESKFILIDESQFLTKYQVNEIVYFANKYDITFICYGLRTDYLTNLFEGSKRLFEVADVLEEIPMICECGNNATVNARLDSENNIIIDENDGQIKTREERKYVSMCKKCYYDKIHSQVVNFNKE